MGGFKSWAQLGAVGTVDLLRITFVSQLLDGEQYHRTCRDRGCLSSDKCERGEPGVGPGSHDKQIVGKQTEAVGMD